MFFTRFPFLRDSQHPAIIPPEWNSLQGLANQLIEGQTRIDQWSALKAPIQQYIRAGQHELNELDDFLRRIIAYGVEQDVSETLAFVADIIDLQLLENMIGSKEAVSSGQQQFHTALEWARGQQPFCPLPIQSLPQQSHHIFWRHWGPLVVYFIPNLINIFLASFDFLDTHRNYMTLWDKYLLLEIIFKFFIIPSFLFKVFKPVVGTTIKTCVVAGLAFVALAACLIYYKLYLKPLPPELINGRNLNHSFARHQRAPICGQADDLQRLVAALSGNSNVLLVGKSGEGKTALIEHFTQLRSRGELPQSLQHKEMHKFDCASFNSCLPQGYKQLLDQLFIDIEENENKVILVLESIDQILSNKEAFRCLKDRFIKDRLKFSFIAAMTLENCKQLEECDPDESFIREVNIIEVDSSENEEQLQLTLHALIDRHAPDLPFGEGALEAIILKSKDGRFLRNVGRPGRIVKILTEAAERCRYTYQSEYVPTKLNRKYQTRELLRRRYQWQISLGNLRTQPEDLRRLNEKISILETTLSEQKKGIAKIRSLYKSSQSMKNFYVRATHHLASQQPAMNEAARAESELMQKKYLLTCFYLFERLKERLEREISAMPKGIPIQITVELIEEVCDDLSKQERLFHEPTRSRSSSSQGESLSSSY